MVRLALRPHWFLVLLEQVRPHLVSYLVSYLFVEYLTQGWTIVLHYVAETRMLTQVIQKIRSL